MKIVHNILSNNLHTIYTGHGLSLSNLNFVRCKDKNEFFPDNRNKNL